MPTHITPPIDEVREESYWQNQYEQEDYHEPGRSYDDYAGAYRTGYQAHERYPGKPYEQIEGELKSDYERNKGASSLGWDKARHAIKSAWHRIERALPGDADRDRR